MKTSHVSLRVLALFGAGAVMQPAAALAQETEQPQPEATRSALDSFDEPWRRSTNKIGDYAIGRPAAAA